MPVALAIGAGLILGSFLSVLLERLPRGGRGIVAGRSACPRCGHVLAWYDLVPLASYAVLSGRCRYCQAPISPLYPTLESSMAVVMGFSVARPADLLILFALVALFFFDLKYQLLPDVIVLPAMAVALARVAIRQPGLVGNAVITGGALAAVFGLMYLVSRGRWLGLGDVKLAVLIGLLFGYPVAVWVTLIAVWAGALVGIAMMFLGRATMKTALPFGSFWTGAAIVALFLSS